MVLVLLGVIAAFAVIRAANPLKPANFGGLTTRSSTPAPDHLLWELSFTDPAAVIPVDDHRVIIAGHDDGFLVSLVDLRTGKLQWTFAPEGLGDTPLVDAGGEFVIVNCDPLEEDARAVLLDRETGEARQVVELPPQSSLARSDRGTWLMVHRPARTSVGVIDAPNDDTTTWRSLMEVDHVPGETAFVERDGYLCVSDSIGAWAQGPACLDAFDMATGDQLPLLAKEPGFFGVVGDTMLLCLLDDAGDCDWSMRERSGKVLWTAPASTDYAWDDGYLVQITAQRRVVPVDPATGRSQWGQPQDFEDPWVLVGDPLVVCAETGKQGKMVTIDPATGRRLRSDALGAPTLATRIGPRVVVAPFLEDEGLRVEIRDLLTGAVTSSTHDGYFDVRRMGEHVLVQDEEGYRWAGLR